MKCSIRLSFQYLADIVERSTFHRCIVPYMSLLKTNSCMTKMQHGRSPSQIEIFDKTKRPPKKTVYYYPIFIVVSKLARQIKTKSGHGHMKNSMMISINHSVLKKKHLEICTTKKNFLYAARRLIEALVALEAEYVIRQHSPLPLTFICSSAPEPCVEYQRVNYR